MQCPFCNAIIDDNSKKCAACGKEISEDYIISQKHIVNNKFSKPTYTDNDIKIEKHIFIFSIVSAISVLVSLLSFILSSFLSALSIIGLICSIFALILSIISLVKYRNYITTHKTAFYKKTRLSHMISSCVVTVSIILTIVSAAYSSCLLCAISETTNINQYQNNKETLIIESNISSEYDNIHNLIEENVN